MRDCLPVRSLLISCSFLLAALAPSAAQAPALWADLRPGDYAVGFTVIERWDSTRIVSGLETARPVQISLWYPARAGATPPPMTYRDYFLLSASEFSLEPPGPDAAREAERELTAMVGSSGVPASAVDAWLSSVMAAHRDAEAAGGRFPLVLIGQGNFHTAYHEAVLAEYLASHGYVVATSPSQSRISGPPRDAEAVLAAAREQAADLEVILETVTRRSDVDSQHVGIVAHSFGARSAFLLMLQTKIDAFVSLDGGIANKQGKDWLMNLKFDPASVHTPILHFFQEVDETVQPDFDLLASLSHSERFVVKVDSLFHPHFTSLGLVVGTIPGMELGPPSPHVVDKIVAVYELTLRFLDAYLRPAESGFAVDEVLASAPDFLDVRTLSQR